MAEETTTATAAGAPTATSTSTVVASVVGYATIIDAPNPDGMLRPGMTATVTLRGSRVDGVWRIPNAALSFRPPDDVLAGITDGRWTEAVGGGPLREGELLATSASIEPHSARR